MDGRTVVAHMSGVLRTTQQLVVAQLERTLGYVELSQPRALWCGAQRRRNAVKSRVDHTRLRGAREKEKEGTLHTHSLRQNTNIYGLLQRGFVQPRQRPGHR